MTKLEIIQELFESEEGYNKNPGYRAANDEEGLCLYRTRDGRMCAVGKCLINPDELKSFVGDVFSLFNKTIEVRKEKGFKLESFDELLQEKYRGHDIKFWVSLQKLHDNFIYWDEAGLSNLGKELLLELKEKYTDN